MSPDTIAILGAVVTMGAIGPGVLVVVLLALFNRLERRMDRLETRMDRLETALVSLSDRVAHLEGRIEGALSVP